jgi:hypothetical protein
MDGVNGQIGGKNRSSTFVLTAFISSGQFNIFLSSGQRRDHTSLILFIHALSDKDGWGEV